MEIIIWFVFEIIFFVVHLCMNIISIPNMMGSMTLTAYSQIVINVLSIYIFRKYLCKTNRTELFHRKNLKHYIWAVVIGIGVCLGHRIFFLVFRNFTMNSIREIGEVAISNTGMFMMTVPGVLYEALLGPVTEEVFFRGIILHVAKQNRGNLYAVIISSFLFAIGHLNGVQFISAFFMGLIIGYVVILTDNVYIGIIIHTMNNIFSLFNANVLNKVWGMESWQPFMQIFLGVIMLVFGIFMIRNDVVKEKRKSSW